MFMDYMFIPILCVIFTSIAAHHLYPFIPYVVWIVAFSAGFTLLNLGGIKVAATTNKVLILVMSVVVFWFMAMAIRYVTQQNGIEGLISVAPFYSSDSFSLKAISSATALAALTYIGFDGLTTLSEEVRNPRRNILLATLFTCVITGIWSGSQVYLAQLAWPDWESFTRDTVSEASKNQSLDKAIMSVANRVGGPVLDGALSVILLIGSVGSGITGQIGGARLLYSMGRDKVIPVRIFGHLDQKHANPSYNIIIIGVLTLAGALMLNYEECARLINFGAFLAFMGVNLACLREFFLKNHTKNLRAFLVDLLPPLAGFIICLIIWLNLPLKTFLIGGSWMLAGIVYLLVSTRGFKKAPATFNFQQP
jgi:amino acid transporter